MIKRILVALGGTPYSRTAVRRAVELAQSHHASVTCVTIADLSKINFVGSVPAGGAAAAKELRLHRRQRVEASIEKELDRAETLCREANIEHNVVRETGDAFSEMRSLWRYHDLTLIGLRGLFDYGVVSNPDDAVVELIAKGVQPILAVAKKYRPIRRVLVAYNGSVESAQAMKSFVQKRMWPDAELRIVAFRSVRKKADALLADASTYCRAHGYHVETDFIDSSARDHMATYAAGWDTDLVVMGSTSRARLFKQVLGDTALRMLQTAEIPLYLAQ